jgi:hypothetical protein
MWTPEIWACQNENQFFGLHVEKCIEICWHVDKCWRMYIYVHKCRWIDLYLVDFVQYGPSKTLPIQQPAAKYYSSSGVQAIVHRFFSHVLRCINQMRIFKLTGATLARTFTSSYEFLFNASEPARHWLHSCASYCHLGRCLRYCRYFSPISCVVDVVLVGLPRLLFIHSYVDWTHFFHPNSATLRARIVLLSSFNFLPEPTNRFISTTLLSPHRV